MKFRLDKKLPNNTLLVVGIRYLTMGDGTKVFSYAMIKAGGLWYVTGSGRVPTAAGYEAVNNWLDRDNREVVSVDLVTETLRILPTSEVVPSSWPREPVVR